MRSVAVLMGSIGTAVIVVVERQRRFVRKGNQVQVCVVSGKT